MNTTQTTAQATWTLVTHRRSNYSFVGSMSFPTYEAAKKIAAELPAELYFELFESYPKCSN